MFILFDFICLCVLFISVCMFYFLLFEIHVYNLFVKMLYFVFNFVLITYKGILQKLSVRKIYISLKERNET